MKESILIIRVSDKQKLKLAGHSNENIISISKVIRNILDKKLKEPKTIYLGEGRYYTGQFLTRKQALNFLNIDIPTLHLLIKRGRVPSFGIGHRRNFKISHSVKGLITFEFERLQIIKFNQLKMFA